VRRLLIGAGAVLVGWGFYGLSTAARHPRPVPWLTFFVGANVLTDLIVAPVVVLAGVVVARLGGARWRPYVVSGLVISGVVLLVGLPLARGYGRRGDNPSILPLDYTRGLAITLAGVWTGVGLVSLVGAARRRRAPGQRTVSGA
jgi:hypothetical protein